MILVHYGEIGLKGKNRSKFENLLIKNIKTAFDDEIGEIQKDYGRILIHENVDCQQIIQKMKKIPGIENISYVLPMKLDIEEFKTTALKIAEEKKFSSFKIETKRGNKSFPYTSIDINDIIGNIVQKNYQKKVDLKQPDLTIFIEIGNKSAYVYTEKVKGIGGLPIGSSGHIISLLSGGIDSPVAAWMMMRRGCNITFTHFYNEVLTASQRKIENIINHLTKTQLTSTAFFIPFGNLQRIVIRKIPAKYRMILYRRIMTKISVAIAHEKKAMAIVTGDSVGQVASQTLENIKCIHESSEIPIFSPLIGLNKQEIIDIARQIGTYDMSVQQYDDCCSFMIAKHPAVRSSLEEIKKMEDTVIFDMNDIITKAVVKEFRAF